MDFTVLYFIGAGVVAGIFFQEWSYRRMVATIPRCENCNAPVDDQTPLFAGAAPKVGDFTICFHCGALGIFDDIAGPRRIRPATPEALARFKARQPAEFAAAIRVAGGFRIRWVNRGSSRWIEPPGR